MRHESRKCWQNTPHIFPTSRVGRPGAEEAAAEEHRWLITQHATQGDGYGRLPRAGHSRDPVNLLSFTDSPRDRFGKYSSSRARHAASDARLCVICRLKDELLTKYCAEREHNVITEWLRTLPLVIISMAFSCWWKFEYNCSRCQQTNQPAL